MTTVSPLRPAQEESKSPSCDLQSKRRGRDLGSALLAHGESLSLCPCRATSASKGSKHGSSRAKATPRAVPTLRAASAHPGRELDLWVGSDRADQHPHSRTLCRTPRTRPPVTTPSPSSCCSGRNCPPRRGRPSFLYDVPLFASSRLGIINSQDSAPRWDMLCMHPNPPPSRCALSRNRDTSECPSSTQLTRRRLQRVGPGPGAEVVGGQ